MSAQTATPPLSLLAIELFRGLAPAELEAAASLARVRRLARNARVFHQGDPDARAHVVLEGAVRIAQSGADGGQIVIRFIGPGQVFGAAPMFTDGLYPADAVAIAETTEASWSQAELRGLMDRHPTMAINAIGIFGERLREAQDRLREMATQPAERRIAHALLRLARQAGKKTPAGTLVGFRLRRGDIADLAGVTLHTASRVLSAWERDGLAATRGQRLTLRDLERLEAIAEGA